MYSASATAQALPPVAHPTPANRQALPSAAKQIAPPTQAPSRSADSLTTQLPAKGIAATQMAFFSAPELKTTTLVPGSAQAIKDGAITCSTVVHIKASPREIVEALKTDWASWWPRSESAHRRTTPEGGTQFDFKPMVVAGQGPTDVNVTTHPLQKDGGNTNASKWVIPVSLDGDFKGQARFEIYAAPDGGSYLKSQWDQVRPTGLKAKGIMPEIVTRMHLWVEGNGLEGLKQHLEKKR